MNAKSLNRDKQRAYIWKWKHLIDSIFYQNYRQRHTVIPITTVRSHCFIIASLKRDSIGKLINRIPGSRLLISSLPGSACFEDACWIAPQASRCQEAFSKPCLVNLLSKKRSPSILGVQWLSGRVLDLRPKGCGLEPHQRHCLVVLEQDTFILA